MSEPTDNLIQRVHGKPKRLTQLADEYRPTMDAEVLHDWAQEVVAALRRTDR
jgi:hypothetical protein